MRRLLPLLLLVCFSLQAHAGRPGAAFTLIEPFQWQGQQIHDFDEMFEIARKLTTRDQVEAFTEALRTTNPDFRDAFSYDLGEFSNFKESRKFAELFKIEHPVFGSVDENEQFTQDTRQVLGVLYMAGIRQDDLKPFRQMFLRVPSSVMKGVFVDLLKSAPEKPTLEFVRKSVESHSRTCTEPFDPHAPWRPF